MTSRINSLFNQGYIFTKLDSQSIINDEIHLYFSLGKKYKWLIANDKGQEYFQSSDLLDSAQNNGFPYAHFTLDSAILSNDSAFAIGKFEKGPFIAMDSLILPLGLKGRYSFYQSIVGWSSPIPFSQQKFQNIEKRFLKVPYLKLIESPDLSFQSQSAWVYLAVKETDQQNIEGILGIQRHPNEDKNMLIGDVRLQLEHLLGRGIDAEFNWQRFDLRSQSLKFNLFRPFAFKSEYHLGFWFNILNQDTSFLLAKTGVDWIKYQNKKSELGLTIQLHSGTALLNDSERNLQNYSSYYAGIKGYLGEMAEKLQTPISGYGLGGSLLLGLKQLADLRSTYVFQHEANFKQQWKLKGRSFYYNTFSWGVIQNDSLAVNEQFRIGGIRTLRGYNEQQFFANTYVTTQNELRWFYDDVLFAILYDAAYLDSITTSKSIFKQSFGFGFGIKSGSGTFRINFAMPIEPRTSQNIQDARIHFNLSSTL